MNKVDCMKLFLRYSDSLHLDLSVYIYDSLSSINSVKCLVMQLGTEFKLKFRVLKYFYLSNIIKIINNPSNKFPSSA